MIPRDKWVSGVMYVIAFVAAAAIMVIVARVGSSSSPSSSSSSSSSISPGAPVESAVHTCSRFARRLQQLGAPVTVPSGKRHGSGWGGTDFDDYDQFTCPLGYWYYDSGTKWCFPASSSKEDVIYAICNESMLDASVFAGIAVSASQSSSPECDAHDRWIKLSRPVVAHEAGGGDGWDVSFATCPAGSWFQDVPGDPYRSVCVSGDRTQEEATAQACEFLSPPSAPL